jgi:hypothetical protein
VERSLVVMAAGRGSRFGGMKQIAELGPSGESLFDYAAYDARRAGLVKAVFIVSAESRGPVEAHVEAGLGRHMPVAYVEQEVGAGRSKPWGTGHAVLCAAAAIDGPFGVINADDFYGRGSFDALGGALSGEPSQHVVVGFTLRESLSPHGGVSRGVCRTSGDDLASIDELHDVQEEGGVVRCREGVELTGDEVFSANLWGFLPSFRVVLEAEFAAFTSAHGDDPTAEFLIGDAVSRLEAYGQKPPRVVRTPERFLGVTYKEDVKGVREELAKKVAAGEYPSPLWG